MKKLAILAALIVATATTATFAHPAKVTTKAACCGCCSGAACDCAQCTCCDCSQCPTCSK